MEWVRRPRGNIAPMTSFPELYRARITAMSTTVTTYSNGALKIEGTTINGLAAMGVSFMATASNAIGKYKAPKTHPGIRRVLPIVDSSLKMAMTESVRGTANEIKAAPANRKKQPPRSLAFGQLGSSSSAEAVE